MGLLFYSGKGIQDIRKISGDSYSGSVDTYMIYYTDNSASTYSVRNGANGYSARIGDNGNWWVNDEDLGVSATHPDLTGYSTKAQADLLYKPIGYEPDLSAYYTKSQNDVLYLGINAQASDSAKFGGQLPSYYQPAGNYEAQLTFSTGLNRVGNTIYNTVSQYTDAMADARVAAGIAGKQTQLNGNGLVRMSGTTVTYDYSNYLTSITYSQIITALSYTPYNAGNPAGYITAASIPASLPASDVYAWAKASSKPSYSWSEIGSKPTTVGGYGITDMSSQSVNYANNAGNATGLSHYPSRGDSAWYNVVWASGSPSPMYSCDAIQIQSSTGTLKATTFQGAGTGLTGLANSLSVYGSTYSSYTEYVGNDSAYMRFHWSGQGGQPTWLWGSGDASNMYVYNPSNFSVNYANTAGHANDAVTKQDGSRYTTDFNSILTSGFYNAESTPSNCPSPYGQLIVAKGIDTGMQIYGGYANDNLWFRGWGGSGSTFYSWRKVWHDGNFTPSNYSLTSHTHDYATHRGEGTNYVDYSRYVYNNGAYSGSGWVEPSDLGVRYASSANYATSAGNASTVGGYTAAQLLANGSNWDRAHSFGNPGYQWFPNGFIIQWGWVIVASGGTASITFPKQGFTTVANIYSYTVTSVTASGNPGGANNNQIFNSTVSGFSVYNGSGQSTTMSWRIEGYIA